MNPEHSIPCPVCRTPIHVDVYQLIRGGRFECEQCHAVISLSPESRPVVRQAMERMDEIKKPNR